MRPTPVSRPRLFRRLTVLILAAALWTVTAEVRAADDVIRVGAVVSMSGPRAVIANHLKRGYDLGVKRANQLGGVRVGNRAYRLELIYRDDESSSSHAARMAADLIERDRVSVLLGPSTSSMVIAVAKVAEAYGVPLVQAGGASLRVYLAGRRYSFGILSTADKYLGVAVDLAARQAVKTGRDPRDLKVALAFQDDGFTRDIRQGVVDKAQRWGMTVVLDETLPNPVEDLGDVLRRVRETKPDLLTLSARATGAGLLARQLADLRVDVPMVALTHCDGAQIENLGRISDYLLCSSQWNAFSSYADRWFGSSLDFEVEFELEYGYTPPYPGAQGAAAVFTLVDAFERAGTRDPERLRDALASTDLRTFFGPIRFDETGKNVAKSMVLLQIQGGRYKAVWPPEAAKSRLIHPMPPWADR